MERYIFAVAFILLAARTDAQVTLVVPRNQTNSVVSFQVILATAVVCITVDETFEITACSDPNRVEVVLDNIKEVVWDRKGRSEICECGSDDLAHSIQGINAGELTVTQIDIESFPIANSAETTPVLAITLTWNLTSVGQASGAEMNFTLSFFTEHQDILFDGQIAEVFNGTIKTTYEFANWQFCASAVDGTDAGKPQTLKQCRKKRDKYKPGKGKLNEAVLELQFNVTKFSADNDTDAIINCFSRKTKKKKTFAPTCQFGDIYRLTYSEITTSDNEEQCACLPFEYPRLHDCETGGDFIIYQERLTKEKDKGKKKDKEKEKKDKDIEKKEKDEDKEKEKEEKEKEKEKDKKKNKNGKCKEKDKKKKDKKKYKENGSLCDRFAFTFAVPKFQVKGRYDPCEGIICSGNTFSLAFSLLMLVLSHTLFGMM